MGADAEEYWISKSDDDDNIDTAKKAELARNSFLKKWY